MNEHYLPIIVSEALAYFWKHCPDTKAQCQAYSQEEWDAMIDEYDRWLVSE